MTVTTTYLELTDPARDPPGAARAPPRSSRVDPPDGARQPLLLRGRSARDYAWTDHLGRDDAWWQAHAEAVETWVIPGRGLRRAATRSGDDVEIAYFGLLPAFHGRGWGGALLEHALRRGFELGARVWVHTCTLDGPHALANYEARGLVAVPRSTR